MVIEKDQSMVFRKIEDDTILVPIRSNVGDLDNIYVLNDVGARIWELIDGQRGIDEISEVISNEYDVPLEEARKDIEEFLKGLEAAGALKMGK